MVKKGEGIVPAAISQKIDAYFARGLARIGASAVEAVRSGRIGVARARFREGFTTEEQFLEELRLLRVSEEELELELASAQLDYATDYLGDLITAYRDAVRKGHISIDQYKDILLELGLVPERVTGYMMKEVARLKPEQVPTVIAPLAPYYETDAGKIQVDTIRRRRRKLIYTRDQEIAALLGTGMPIAQATSAADNDDVRLAEKGGEE